MASLISGRSTFCAQPKSKATRPRRALPVFTVCGAVNAAWPPGFLGASSSIAASLGKRDRATIFLNGRAREAARRAKRNRPG